MGGVGNRLVTERLQKTNALMAVCLMVRRAENGVPESEGHRESRKERLHLEG